MRTEKPTEPTLLRLAPEDRTALRREALRRLEAGEAIRLDVSAIVRELLCSWREGRPAEKGAAR